MIIRSAMTLAATLALFFGSVSRGLEPPEAENDPQQPATTTQPATQPERDDTGEDPIHITIDDWMWRMSQYGIQGAVLVRRGNEEIILRAGYGNADHAHQTLITPDTIFDIGSIGMQFTVAAVLLLESRGALRVRDSIAKYLENVPRDKQAITLHQLLTHTSGLPHHVEQDDVLAAPLASIPGERYLHSNAGYRLLARVVSEVSRRRFTSFVEENIFQALGLTSTAFRGALDAPRERFARAYLDESAQQRSDAAVNLDRLLGAGGIVSTVDDLDRWAQALRNHTLLDEDATSRMFTPYVHARHEHLRVGYGWSLAQTERETTVAMHTGDFNGFNGELRMYPEEDVTIVFLSNHTVHGRPARSAVMDHLSQLVLGTETSRGRVPQPPPPVTLTSWEAAQLRGVYALGDEGAIMLEPTADGTAVRARVRGQRAINLLFSPWADEDDDAFISSCNERGSALVQSMFDNNPEILERERASELAHDAVWSTMRNLSRNLELHHGTLQSVQIIGTAIVAGPRTGRTFLDLQFVDGNAMIAVTFAPELVRIEEVDHGPEALLRPVSSYELCRFDAFTGRTNVLACVDQIDGTIESLRIEIDLGHYVTLKHIVE